MTADPRVVFGMPAYNRPDALTETLESLLSQTCGDFAIVIVDDSPSPAVKSVVERYSVLDPRITYEPNPVRLGMIGNWRRAFERSREIYPESEYFAWVSDHDVWHPRWLEVLAAVLDAQPRVVLAYPQSLRLHANERRRVTTIVETVDVPSRAQRLQIAATRLTAGNAIYGLFRASALRQAGVFPTVVMPDRQLLVELSVFGEFRHVPEILWYREVEGSFSYGRQRRMFFPGGTPLYAHLPANVQHCAVLVWDLGVLGRGHPAFGRSAGLRYAALHLWYSTKKALLRDDASWREALRRTALGRWLPGGRAERKARRRAAA